MNRLYIKFPLVYPDGIPSSKPDTFPNGCNGKYVISLYENYADKILGFIICHDYNQEAAEKILLKVFITINANLPNYQPCDRLLLKLIGIAAQYIRQEKLITYCGGKKNCEHLEV